MLAGIHWKNTEAIVNGRTLTKVTAREGLYFTEGYLELEEGILVKINPSAESVIKIQKNKINIKENLINSRMRTEHISRDLKSPPFVWDTSSLFQTRSNEKQILNCKSNRFFQRYLNNYEKG